VWDVNINLTPQVRGEERLSTGDLCGGWKGGRGHKWLPKTYGGDFAGGVAETVLKTRASLNYGKGRVQERGLDRLLASTRKGGGKGSRNNLGKKDGIYIILKT